MTLIFLRYGHSYKNSLHLSHDNSLNSVKEYFNGIGAYKGAVGSIWYEVR